MALAEKIECIVLDEFHCSEPFRLWLGEQVVGPMCDPHRYIGGFLWVRSDPLGGADRLLLMEEGGRRIAILLDHKYEGSPQREQAERLRDRGQEGIATGRWVKFGTCVIAPERYLQSMDDAREYDSQISYEALRDWFEQSGQDTDPYRSKAQLLSDAIEKRLA